MDAVALAMVRITSWCSGGTSPTSRWGSNLARGDEDFRLAVDRALSQTYASAKLQDFSRRFGVPDEAVVTGRPRCLNKHTVTAPAALLAGVHGRGRRIPFRERGTSFLKCLVEPIGARVVTFPLINIIFAASRNNPTLERDSYKE